METAENFTGRRTLIALGTPAWVILQSVSPPFREDICLYTSTYYIPRGGLIVTLGAHLRTLYTLWLFALKGDDADVVIHLGKLWQTADK